MQELKASTIQKYKSKTVSQLLKAATKRFNAYIRRRDKNRPCISCGQFKSLQAGHFYPAGQYPMLRFNEHNVNGECIHCNYFSGDHLISYRRNLIKKIGEVNVNKLDDIAAHNKRTLFKWDRIHLISIIETYK